MQESPELNRLKITSKFAKLLKIIKKNLKSDNSNENSSEIIFTIIITVEDSQKHLADAIESVTGQNFPLNGIEIVLIYCSEKGSETCEDYAFQCQNSVVHIKRECETCASVLNEGLKHSNGKFITFLESEDLLDKNTLREVNNFFKSHGREIDVVCTPVRDINTDSIINPDIYKFSRIVDIQNEYDFVQNSLNGAFIRKAAITEYFNTRMPASYDSLFINRIIINRLKYGVVKSAGYVKRNSEPPECFDRSKYFREMIAYSMYKYDLVLRYVQSVLIIDIEEIFKKHDILNNKQDNSHVHCALQYIDDDLISSQSFSEEIKSEILEFKYEVI